MAARLHRGGTLEMNAREIKLVRKAKQFRAGANDELIRSQIKQAELYGELDYTANPRADIHLDSTRLGLHADRVRRWRAGELVAPITIDMALTQRCSYACTFCYAGLQQNPQAPVSWAVYETFLEDCAEIGVQGISLVSDGESTENPALTRFIVKATDLGIACALGTNGLKLTDFETIVPRLTYLRFNFNAADPRRYAQIMGTSVRSYNRVTENIYDCVQVKRATGSRCMLGLQQVLLPEYADEVLPLAKLGRQLGVDYLLIKHCSDDEDGRLGVDYGWYKTETAQALFRAAEAYSRHGYSVQAKWSKFKTGRDRTYSKCFGPPLLLQISGSGIVAPCGSFFNDRYKKFHIGDLKTTRFKEIWQGEAYRRVMSHLASDRFDPRKECATLCLQDKVNEALFDWVEKGETIPAATPGADPAFI